MGLQALPRASWERTLVHEADPSEAAGSPGSARGASLRVRPRSMSEQLSQSGTMAWSPCTSGRPPPSRRFWTTEA